MKKLYIPKDESELAVIKSILDFAELPYYVRNEYFGSLYIGVAMGSFNSKPIFVHEDYFEDAKELLSKIVNEDEFEPLEQEEEPTPLESIVSYVSNIFSKKS